MYYNQMEDYQQMIYQEFIQSIEDKEKLQITDQTNGKQISNIVYPSIDMLNDDYDEDDINFKKMYGSKGLENLLDSKIKSGRKIYNYKKNVPPIFSLDYLQSISCKMYSILSGLRKKKAKGIIFIYSEFIQSGIVPLALALEHLGFEKYSGNHLKYPEWKKIQEIQKMNQLIIYGIQSPNQKEILNEQNILYYQEIKIYPQIMMKKSKH